MTIRVGFIISHPFQYQFYAPIARKFNDAVFIIEGRVKTPFTFSDEFIAQLDGTIVNLDTDELLAVDGLVDVIFCMTPVHVLKLFKVSKVIALQYSMAKENYQYGPWRIAADLNLMQGEYSNSKISGFCMSEVVGNPRYDGYVAEEKGGGGLLYMPTYGELSSLSQFFQALPGLPSDLKIKVKLHHASEFETAAIIESLKLDSRVEIIDGYANALDDIAKADVVVSDYSGAIFDALYLDRPIVLLQPPVDQTKLRTDHESIEVAEAQRIGPVVSFGRELPDAIRSAIDNAQEWEETRRSLRSRIYAYEGKSADRIVDAVSALVNGAYAPSSTLRELKTTYIRYIEDNRKLREDIKRIAAKPKPAPKTGQVSQSKKVPKKKASLIRRFFRFVYKPFKQ